MGVIISRRFEVSTTGFDQDLQGVGSDAQGGAGYVGLRVPLVADTNGRLTFALCGIRVGAQRRVRLVGFRQLLTIGTYVSVSGGLPAYPLEASVSTPQWRFVDGNVLWGIRFVQPNGIPNFNSNNAEGLVYRYSRSPSLLYEAVAAGVVTAPFGGLFPGKPLTPQYGSFYDMRAPWPTPELCDLTFEGPGDIVFFASVLQSNPATRFSLPPIVDVPVLTTTGITNEDAFTNNYTNPANSSGVVYWRIGGALIFEEDQAQATKPNSEYCPPIKLPDSVDIRGYANTRDSGDER